MDGSVGTVASFCATTFAIIVGLGFVAYLLCRVADKLDVTDAFDDDHNYYRRM